MWCLAEICKQNKPKTHRELANNRGFVVLKKENDVFYRFLEIKRLTPIDTGRISRLRVMKLP